MTAIDPELPEIDDAFVHTYVVPYYFQWMEQNALSREAQAQFEAVRTNASKLSDSDIRLMLCHHWRIQVMGAWYAAARRDVALTDAVHASIRHCYGTLTAAALCVAAITHHSADTADVLASYRARAVERHDGSVDIVTAAITHLEPDGPFNNSRMNEVWTGSEHRSADSVLRDLLDVAQRLHVKD